MTTATDADMQRIYREASGWIVLGDERPLTDEEEAEFEEWRHADPRHDQIYRAMLVTWDDVPPAAELVSARPARADNVIAFAPVVAEPPAAEATRRRRWLVGLSAVAAAILLFLIVPAIVPFQADKSYQTALSEQRIVRLTDGSQVTLGPRSKLDVAFTDGARRVVLTGGEAFFEVAHDRSRPFFVEAGSSLIRVVGTKFDVNVGAGTVRVAVLDGIVHVSERGTAAKAVQVIRKGQRIEMPVVMAAAVTPAGTVNALPAVAPATQPPGAWREGRLMYDNVRLADLIADVNRYYGPGVRINDPALADLRVTAFFSQNEIPAFLGSLPDIVAVRTTEEPSGSFRIDAP